MSRKISRRTAPRVAPSFVAAAVLAGMIAQANSASAARVEAYVGEPFGVGVITMPVSGGGPVAPLEDERFTVESADGRALYPAVKEAPVRRLLRRLLEIDSPASVTMYFLFRGDGPLDLKAYAPNVSAAAVTPQQNPDAHRRLMGEWWQAYSGRWKTLRANPTFPPVVENFLTVNLSRRLGLALPTIEPSMFAFIQPKRTVWDDLLVTERLQMEVDQELLSAPSADPGNAGPLPAQLPWLDLPPATILPAIEPPAGNANAEALPAPPANPGAPPAPAAAPSPIEPLAAHVPVECFYLRFGNFSNYLWFRDLNKKWDGDLGNMLFRRGIDRTSSHSVEQQLGLKENALAKILGPQVIADVAIIGLDTFRNEGAAIGILFQAKNSPLLTTDLTNQRNEAMKKYADATQSTVQITGRDVSLVTSPRAEVRSYYIADGDFHLVTTSRRLVERFLQAGQGDHPLADSAGFQGVRQQSPGDRGDSFFAYIAPEFIRNLTSPGIWIESRRRLQTAREIKLLELARLEAAAEGSTAKSVADLVAAGYLPASFGEHGDGSRLVDDGHGLNDSLRGTPGLFIPACDMPATTATPAEAAAYQRFADRFRQEVGQTAPIAIAAHRTPLADGSGETVAADILATPLLDTMKFGKLIDMLAEPAAERVTPIPGDLIHADAVVKPILPLGGQTDSHHLVLGVRDFHSPLVVRQGAIAPGGDAPAIMRFYLTSWPKPGMLRMFAGPNAATGPEPTPTVTNMWQGVGNDFMLICFSSELVREILPQLAVQPVDVPAQAWVDVQNVAGTELEATVNALGYQRARETSVAACRLMNTLGVQLHEPAADCRATAEDLVDGSFLCALGGEYKTVETPGGRTMWTSTALTPQNQFLLTEAPADFHLPALTWFKGTRAELSKTKQALTAHVEIDMARSAVP